MSEDRESLIASPTINDARLAFDEFYRLWFMELGGSRVEGVAAAFHADDVIEALCPEDWNRPEIDGWIEALSHCPDVEKRWHGIAEYREMHRTSKAAVPDCRYPGGPGCPRATPTGPCCMESTS